MPEFTGERDERSTILVDSCIIRFVRVMIRSSRFFFYVARGLGRGSMQLTTLEEQ